LEILNCVYRPAGDKRNGFTVQGVISQSHDAGYGRSHNPSLQLGLSQLHYLRGAILPRGVPGRMQEQTYCRPSAAYHYEADVDTIPDFEGLLSSLHRILRLTSSLMDVPINPVRHLYETILIAVFIPEYRV
jgi:hypothetical protein